MKTENMKYNNITVKYNPDNWSVKDGKKRMSIESLLVAMICGVAVMWFIGIVRLLSEFNITISMFMAIVGMFCSMIFMLKIVEKSMYDGTPIRFLDSLTNIQTMRCRQLGDKTYIEVKWDKEKEFKEYILEDLIRQTVPMCSIIKNEIKLNNSNTNVLIDASFKDKIVIDVQ